MGNLNEPFGRKHFKDKFVQVVNYLEKQIQLKTFDIS